MAKFNHARRHSILDGAHKLFVTKGYSETTLKDITYDADMNLGVLYYYYKTKEEILDTVLKEISYNDKGLFDVLFFNLVSLGMTKQAKIIQQQAMTGYQTGINGTDPLTTSTNLVQYVMGYPL